MAKPTTIINGFITLAFIFFSADHTSGQADPQNYLFNSGQTIQPFFEGWSHNDDGSFEMHFGYLNRNYVESLHVPIGSTNRFDSGDLDQGQPTFFYPRVNRRVFSVTVPEDFGETEIVWSLVTNDETYRAVGWLQAEWEIDPNPRARFYSANNSQAANQAPTLTVGGIDTVTLPATLTLTASVSDDGLPEPRERNFGPGVILPTFEPEGPTLPVNVPQIQSTNRLRPTRVNVDRIAVTWTQWRGASGVTLQSQDESPPDQGVVTVSFEQPGDYLFRIEASDGVESTTKDISVTVR